MVIRNLFILLLIIPFIHCPGQDRPRDHKKVYHLNYNIDGPVTASLLVANYYGFKWLKSKPDITERQLASYNRESVPGFDRSALDQQVGYMYRAQTISDWGRNVTLLMPALLFIDKKIRADWVDIALLYAETQAINLSVYFLAGPGFTHKARPLVYYPEVPLNYKISDGATDSWFSAHTSSTAAASFFMAKVYSDYHPELGAKKYLLYAAALIPPAFVGFHRYKGLKHFPQDVFVGAAVGAAIGVLIPHFHKIKTKKGSNLTVVPFTGENTGVAMSLRF
jgi:membrane-associated phospholipid phosphatase